MVKAHIQIPDKLHAEAKALAERKEWSFAEVVRRGLEYMTEVNRHGLDEHDSKNGWSFPTIKGGGPVTRAEVRDAINELRDGTPGS